MDDDKGHQATEELAPREPGATELLAENLALRALAHCLGADAQTVLNRLSELALDLTGAGSAGVSLLETTADGEETERWAALAGAYAGREGRVVSASHSPGAQCLARGTPLRFYRPGRHFAGLEGLEPPIVELLMVPLPVEGGMRATLWTAAPERRGFDAETARALSSLAETANAGLRMTGLATGSAIPSASSWTDTIEYKRAMVENALDCIISTDREGRIVHFNPAAERTFGYRREEVVGRDVADIIFPQHLAPVFSQGLDRYLKTGESQAMGQRLETSARRADATVFPVELTLAGASTEDGKRFAIAFIRDITELKQDEAAEQTQQRALEQVARHAPLSDVLVGIIRDVEALSGPGVRGSILLLDDDGKHLVHGAAPSLPDTFIEALEGVEVGPERGAAAASVFHMETIISPDIAQDPVWGPLAEPALEHGLRAAWALPIPAAGGATLGTFAMYHDQPHQPRDWELRLLLKSSNSAAMAIERSRADIALRASERRYQAAFEQVAVGIAELEADGRILLVNDTYCRITGYRREELVGQPVWHLLHEDDRADSRRQFAQLIGQAGPSSYTAERRFVRKDGSLVWYQTTTSTVRTAESKVHLLAVVEDIEERRRWQEALQSERERLDLALDSAEMGVWELDLTTDRLTVDARFRAIYGIGPEAELSGTGGGFSRVHPADRGSVAQAMQRALDPHAKGHRHTLEYRILTPEGTERWVLTSARVYRKGEEQARQPIRMIGTTLDITERKRMEQQLYHHAFHDPLTDLPNRAYFFERLAQVAARTARHHGGYALLAIDLDNFKQVNDRLGHAAGDRLLVEFARLMRRYLRPEDTLARLGGDEFCLLVEGIENKEYLPRMVNRIQQTLTEQPLLAELPMPVSISVGITFEEDGQRQPDTALQDADLALYRAKHLGKGRHVVFEGWMRAGSE